MKKINQLLADIERNGNAGIGHPEPLKENLSGYWSRTIDEKNRLVYKIEDGLISLPKFYNSLIDISNVSAIFKSVEYFPAPNSTCCA